jgi:hypothetical protein
MEREHANERKCHLALFPMDFTLLYLITRSALLLIHSFIYDAIYIYSLGYVAPKKMWEDDL